MWKCYARINVTVVMQVFFPSIFFTSIQKPNYLWL